LFFLVKEDHFAKQFYGSAPSDITIYRSVPLEKADVMAKVRAGQRIGIRTWRTST
jgi:hypothetical protein